MVEIRRSSSSNATTSLPAGFIPSSHSVIIGRAKECKQAVGNKRLRVIAKSFLPKYSTAINRSIKSQIVSEIVAMIRGACPVGAFIKKVGNGKDDYVWAEVSDSVAREKVGYTFRDLLSDQYRSSSKSKALKRQRDQEKAQNSIARNSQESLNYKDCMRMAARALKEEPKAYKPMPVLSTTLFNLENEKVEKQKVEKPPTKENQWDDVFDDRAQMFVPQLRRKSEFEWMDMMRIQLLGEELAA